MSTFKNTLKIAIFSILLLVVIISTTFFGVWFWYKNSVYNNYYQTSIAILERDYNKFYDQIDFDQVLKNFPKSTVPEAIIIPQEKEQLKGYLQPFLATVKANKLAKNPWEVFNNSDFKVDGQNYTLDLYPSDGFSSITKFRLTYILSDKSWKIGKIDVFFGPEEYNFEQMQNEYQKQKEESEKNLLQQQTFIPFGQVYSDTEKEVKILKVELGQKIEVNSNSFNSVASSFGKVELQPKIA